MAVVGCSTDPVDLNRAFAEAQGFTFPLICDESGDVCKLFGAVGAVAIGAQKAKRITAVIRKDKSYEVINPFDARSGPRDLLSRL
mmetsp:Transcript_14945/g.44289  ORF Transcript_14945/g.44289 Transcript_14945/m.44289 type:complete len:85 (-) Transcript_14945:174-428(-)